MNYVSEAFEKQMEAKEYLSLAYTYPMLRKGVTEAERKMWATDIHALHRAVPYYWNARTTDIVRNMMTSFKLEDIICSRNLVHSDVGWCYFPDMPPFEVKEFNSEVYRPVRAITWYFFGEKGQSYLGCTGWGPSAISDATGRFTGPLTPMIWSSVWAGQPMSLQVTDEQLSFCGYSDDRTVLEIDWLRQFVVAANTFIRQEILPVERVTLERKARKRLGIDKSKHLPYINVVQLRKVHHKKNEDPEHHKVDWNWQWTVRGHVRRHWYPSLGEHLPIIIAPYAKGPDDKPFKPRSTPIFSVTR